MRVFISHCISDSPSRPRAFRDLPADVEELRLLGKAIEDAGHRVFEFKHQREETSSDDILDVMARQISLADVVVLVLTRSSYKAPGWTVPELFYAHASKKPVLSCALGAASADFAKITFGDSMKSDRFRSLLPPGVVCPGVPALLQRLAKLRSGARATAQESDAFALSQQLFSWGPTRWQCDGSIEIFLKEYHKAWVHGFYPARFFLKEQPAPVAGALVEKVSTWIDSQHVVVLWRAPRGVRCLTLLDVGAGPRATATLPAGESLVTAGTSQNGALVIVTTSRRERMPHTVTLRQIGADGTELHCFKASLSAAPAVTSGVMGDRWFSGSELLQVEWGRGQLTQVQPQVEDYALFQHFSLLDAPADPLPPAEEWGLASDTPGTLVLFASRDPRHKAGAGADEAWTLLPEGWQYLRGSTAEGRHLLLTWHSSGVWWGSLDSRPRFSPSWAQIEAAPDDGLQSAKQLGDDGLLGLIEQICQEHKPKVPHPTITLQRGESEGVLTVTWRVEVSKGSRLRGLFTFTASLQNAQNFSRQILDFTLADETASKQKTR